MQINCFDVAYAMRSLLSVFMGTRVNWKLSNVSINRYSTCRWQCVCDLVQRASFQSIHWRLSIKYYCISGPSSSSEHFLFIFFFEDRPWSRLVCADVKMKMVFLERERGPDGPSVCSKMTILIFDDIRLCWLKWSHAFSFIVVGRCPSFANANLFHAPSFLFKGDARYLNYWRQNK